VLTAGHLLKQSRKLNFSALQAGGLLTSLPTFSPCINVVTLCLAAGRHAEGNEPCCTTSTSNHDSSRHVKIVPMHYSTSDALPHTSDISMSKATGALQEQSNAAADRRQEL